MRRIESGECTPFLGAGASYPALPLGAEVAKQWAEAYGYPKPEEAEDLVRIAQFLAVQYDSTFPKDEIRKLLKGKPAPDFAQPDEPHDALAQLPLPVYMTTNYDSFMVQALENRRKKPVREMCYWNRLIDSSSSVFSNGGHDPDPSNPLVYHLHGCLDDKHSIVITEDDYLDFLVKLGKDDQLLPPRIQRAVCGSSLLFLGYALSDWTFRVLFRGLVHGMEGSGRSVSVTVQLAPGDQEYKEYLSEYFGKNNMRVYWGTAWQFATELTQKWTEYAGGRDGG